MSISFSKKPKGTRILVVGPAWVGDMVMANSLFQLLKRKNPNATIDVLAPDWTRPLLSRMPEVRRALSLNLKHGELALKERYKIGMQLRRYAYQEAIVLPNSWKSGLIPWIAQIPKRTGWRGEMRYGLLNDLRILNEKKYPLMVERYCALGFPDHTPLPVDLPEPHLIPNEEAAFFTLQKFQIADRQQKIIALCPGAEFGPSKRWPENYFAKVAQHFLKENYAVWLFGSQKDAEVAAAIQAETSERCVDFTGKTTLAEAIDLLSLVNVVVSNDSGLMHIAASLKKPVVAIYGSTSPGFTPPLSEEATVLQRTDIPCSPCFKRECPLKHHDCMKKLNPEKVIEAVQQKASM